jgi:hypothetical protein
LPELVARHALELSDLRNLLPQRAVEQFVLDLLGIAAPDPERDAPGDVGEDRPDRIGDRLVLDVEAHRHVAAADIEADAADRDVLLIGDHATDRLRIAEVAVGAEHAAGDTADRHATSHLLDRVIVVVSEHLEFGHGPLLSLNMVRVRCSAHRPPRSRRGTLLHELHPDVVFCR